MAADEELIDGLLAGSEHACRTLVERYSPPMLAAARAAGAGEDAADVVQEAWVSAVAALGDFRRDASLRTWLVRITINKTRNLQRAAASRPQATAGLDGEDPTEHLFDADGRWLQRYTSAIDADPDTLLEQQDLLRCFEHHVAQLPPQQRQVFELRSLGALGFEEICNALDLTASNARVLLHRARTRLLAMVDHYLKTGEC